MSAQWVHLDTNKVLSDGWQINPKLYNESSSPKFEITGNPWEYNLKINDVDNKDKGNYKCDTEIDGKPLSILFTLVIIGTLYRHKSVKREFLPTETDREQHLQ